MKLVAEARTVYHSATVQESIKCTHTYICRGRYLNTYLPIGMYISGSRYDSQETRLAFPCNGPPPTLEASGYHLRYHLGHLGYTGVPTYVGNVPCGIHSLCILHCGNKIKKRQKRLNRNRTSHWSFTCRSNFMSDQVSGPKSTA